MKKINYMSQMRICFFLLMWFGISAVVFILKALIAFLAEGLNGEAFVCSIMGISSALALFIAYNVRTVLKRKNETSNQISQMMNNIQETAENITRMEKGLSKASHPSEKKAKE